MISSSSFILKFCPFGLKWSVVSFCNNIVRPHCMLYYGKTMRFKDIFIIFAARVHFHAKNGRTYFKGFIFATACINGQIPGVNYLIMQWTPFFQDPIQGSITQFTFNDAGVIHMPIILENSYRQQNVEIYSGYLSTIIGLPQNISAKYIQQHISAECKLFYVSTCGSFNNYVDQMLPNFDHLLPSSGKLSTFYILSTKCGFSTDHLPTSSCLRSY